MITVLHLRDTDRVCGPGKTIIETAKAASRGEFRHKIGLLLLERETHNAYLDAATEQGVEVIPLRLAHRFDPRVIQRIVRVIREHRIDLVHSHDYKSDMLAWAAARFHRVPIMTTVHGWIWNNLRYQVYWRTAQALMPRFDLVIAVSEETRAAARRCGVPEAKLVTIHNGIVTENYDPEGVAPGRIRARWGIPGGAPLVGCVGRISPEKGQRDLLVAAAQVLRTHPDVWFLFAGDGPDRATVEQQAAHAGIAHRVVFAGHMADPRPVFRDIDILALTSHTEGFPNVVLEALCMRTPVLATDVGGVREIVEDGTTGVLLPAHQPDRIAEGLRQLLDRPEWARRLAQAGHATVLKHFTFGQRVLKEETVMRQLVPARTA